MKKNKDICKPPYYYEVDEQTMQLVQDQLRIALPLLHSKMLQACSDVGEAFPTPTTRRKLQIVLQETCISSSLSS